MEKTVFVNLKNKENEKIEIENSNGCCVVMSELALANVEALAQDYETPDGRKLYEHHCGDSPGTQCKPLGVTGNPCPVERSCP